MKDIGCMFYEEGKCICACISSKECIVLDGQRCIMCNKGKRIPKGDKQ